MSLRHARITTALALLLLSLATVSNAVVLWDQSNLNAAGEGSLNLSANSCSMINGNTKLHTASDVTFTTDVVITSVTIYESYGNVEAASQAYLWIAPKTGSLPTESSTLVNNAANLVTITPSYVTVNGVACVAVTASGLSRSLPAGDYWVSLTPRHSLGFFPYTIHLVTDGPVVGAPTCGIVACTANSDWLVPLAPASWDYSLVIQGDAPVPTLGTSWGRLKSFYR